MAAGRASPVVAAIDQGTTSTRCILFSHDARVVAVAQREHRQWFPRPGWVEHDPAELWANTCAVTGTALDKAGLAKGDVAAIGIANQRETTLVWDRGSGEPVGPAIVWQDTRTRPLCDELAARGGGTDRYRDRTGLPLATYFAAPKAAWLLDNIDGARRRAERGDLAFGTVDSWLVWNLTGGAGRGVHVTDATNASRTLLLDLATLQWAPDIAADIGVPLRMLPEIRPSATEYGTATAGPLAGVPVAGILGDQQAAMFGQACLDVGDAKNTYGTGNFLLLNTGAEPVRSEHGLITTVCYVLPGRDPVYALEGSIAVTGSLVQWLRDNLGLIAAAAEVEGLARTVPDNGGVYFVPAFSGLFAPHWRPDARGTIVGLTGFAGRGHIARAALEATAYQTREVVEAMRADCATMRSAAGGAELRALKVDGGMVGNELLMQFQADVLGVPVVRPEVTETTALGAAYAAGLAVGFWSSTDDIRANWRAGGQWDPALAGDERERLYAGWRKAVTRSLGWAS